MLGAAAARLGSTTKCYLIWANLLRIISDDLRQSLEAPWMLKSMRYYKSRMPSILRAIDDVLIWKPQLEQMKLGRILIVDNLMIGDFLIGLHASHTLKTLAPDLVVDLLCNEAVGPLAKGTRLFENVMMQQAYFLSGKSFRSYVNFLRTIPYRSYDLVLDYSGDPRSLVALWLAGCRNLASDAQRGGKAFVRWWIPPKKNPQHVLLNLQNIVSAVAQAGGWPNRSEATIQHFLMKKEATPRLSPSNVVLSFGASSSKRRMPMTYAVKLCRALKASGEFDVVKIATDPKLDVESESVAQECSCELVKENLVGLLNVLSNAALVIGMDSMIGHLAVIAGTPTLTFFTSEEPDYTRPWSEHSGVITVCPVISKNGIVRPTGSARWEEAIEECYRQAIAHQQ